MDTEGSVMVDGQTPEIKEGDQAENINNQGDPNTQKDSQVTDPNKDGEKTAEGQAPTKTDKTGEEGEDKKQGLTDKGTKLATDPLQQANQLRANAESRVRQFEEFLSDPVRVKAYLEEIAGEHGKDKQENPTDANAVEGLIDPDKLETVDDLKKFAKQLQTASDKKIKELEQKVNGVSQSQTIRATAEKVGTEIAQVQMKFPELREFNEDGSKNPEYNEDLDKAVGELYNLLDFDPSRKAYRGKYSVMKIAESVMKIRGLGEKTGSTKAQTAILDKRTGRVITNQAGGTDGQPDESKLSASQTIAERMKRAALRAGRK